MPNQPIVRHLEGNDLQTRRDLITGQLWDRWRESIRWKTQDGRELPLKNMVDQHLTNALAYIKKSLEEGKRVKLSLAVLTLEATYRGLEDPGIVFLMSTLDRVREYYLSSRASDDQIDYVGDEDENGEYDWD